MDNQAQIKLENIEKAPHAIDLETKASNFLTGLAPLGERGDKDDDPMAFRDTYAENVKLNIDLEGTKTTDPIMHQVRMANGNDGVGQMVVKVGGSLLLVIVLVLGGSYILDDPLGIIAHLTDYGRRLAMLLGLETNSEIAQVVKKPGDNSRKKPVAVVKPLPLPKPVQPQFDPQMVENPYWFLPNQPIEVAPLGVDMSEDEAERWEAGMGHEFVYQHYKTVREIRKSHAAGSDHLLYEALEDPKLWTRMEALLGLVELGVNVDLALVEKAVHDKRTSLVKNYFKRFYNAPKPSAVFVMKHALRIVDAKARRVILENLLHLDDAAAPLYIAAATFDPNPYIRNWALSPPQTFGVTASVMQRYQNLVAREWQKKSSGASSQNAAQAVAGPSMDDNNLIKNVTIGVHAVGNPKGNFPVKKDANGKDVAPDARPEVSEQDKIHPEEFKVEDGFDTLKAKDIIIEEGDSPEEKGDTGVPPVQKR